MTKINLEGFTVAMKAQGLTKEVDVSTFHPDAVDAILTYGVRRWFQDNINSAAATANKADVEFDAEAAFKARLDQALSGDITTRTASDADPLDAYRIAVVRGWMKGSGKAVEKLKAAYSSIPSDDQSARREFLLEIARKNAEIVEPEAAELKKRDEALKAAPAALDIAI